MEKTGAYKRIHDKWLGVLAPGTVSLSTVSKYIAIIVVVLLLLLAHVEGDHGGDAVDAGQEGALLLPQLGKLVEEVEVLRQVLAVGAHAVLNLHTACQSGKPTEQTIVVPRYWP